MLTVAGAPEATCPAVAGAASGGAVSAGGSALAEEARAPEVARQAAKIEARRKTTDDGFTSGTLNRVCLTSLSSLTSEIRVVVHS